MKRTYRTKEEKGQLLQQVDDLKKEGLTAQQGCEKAGIKPGDYYSWKKQLGKKKRRKSRKPIVETAIVPMTTTHRNEIPDYSQDNEPPRGDVIGAAKLLAQMNAESLRTLLRG